MNDRPAAIAFVILLEIEWRVGCFLENAGIGFADLLCYLTTPFTRRQ